MMRYDSDPLRTISTRRVARLVWRTRSSIAPSRDGPVGARVGHVQATNPARKPPLEPSVLGLLGRVGVGPVVEVVHLVHTGLKHLLRAPEARTHGRVDRASLHRNAETRRRQ